MLRQISALENNHGNFLMFASAENLLQFAVEQRNIGGIFQESILEVFEYLCGNRSFKLWTELQAIMQQGNDTLMTSFSTKRFPVLG